MPRSGNSEQIIDNTTDVYFNVTRILKEKKVKGVTKYLLEWADIDPATGKVYKPSWVCEVWCIPLPVPQSPSRGNLNAAMLIVNRNQQGTSLQTPSAIGRTQRV